MNYAADDTADSTDAGETTAEGITTEATTADAMTAEEKRHDQLTTAPEAVEADAAPRIDVTEKADGVTRIDWRDDAPVRPGERE
ncbi:MAG: multidrug transporter [Glaciihabitans sp.]|nr:multidrug transporter [Glaciihabitans sp.]